MMEVLARKDNRDEEIKKTKIIEKERMKLSPLEEYIIIYIENHKT